MDTFSSFFDSFADHYSLFGNEYEFGNGYIEHIRSSCNEGDHSCKGSYRILDDNHNKVAEVYINYKQSIVDLYFDENGIEGIRPTNTHNISITATGAGLEEILDVLLLSA